MPAMQCRPGTLTYEKRMRKLLLTNVRELVHITAMSLGVESAENKASQHAVQSWSIA